MARVGIVDVAREVGVSVGTVSNALNHPERVRAETRRLIEDAVKRLGYVPNQSARLLAGGRNATIALVLPRLNHGASLQIANGAQAEAQRLGLGLLIANANEDPALEQRAIDYFMGIPVAGLLVQPVDAMDWHPSSTAPERTVYLGMHSDQRGYYVAADNRGQGRVVAAHVIGLGATRLAVIGHATKQQLRLRLEGIRTALAERPDIDCEVLDAGAWNASGDGYSLGQQLARRPDGERPDAIIGLTDVLAAGALAGAVAAGARVPDDLIIAGTDGNPLAWTGAIPLTTCAPVSYEIGRRGVRLLSEVLESLEARDDGPRSHDPRAQRASADEDAPDHQVELVRPFLLARASTGASPTAASVASLDLAERAARIPEVNIGALL